MNHWQRKFLIVILIINLIFVFCGCNSLEKNEGYSAQPTEELPIKSDSKVSPIPVDKTVNF